MSGNEERLAILDIARDAGIGDEYSIMCAVLDHFEARIACNVVDPDALRKTIKEIIAAICESGRPARQSKKPARGIGHDLDDALVVASLADHGNSLARAIKAHWPKANEDDVKVHAKRIRKHKRQIEAAGVPDRT